MPPRLSDRLLAWLVCGPVGHLLAGVADWLELGFRLAARPRATGLRRR